MLFYIQYQIKRSIFSIYTNIFLGLTVYIRFPPPHFQVLSARWWKRNDLEQSSRLLQYSGVNWNHGPPCSTSVLIPLWRESLPEQLVINKPRRLWNYDRLNTSPSSLFLHPSIQPTANPFIHNSVHVLMSMMKWDVSFLLHCKAMVAFTAALCFMDEIPSHQST